MKKLISSIKQIRLGQILAICLASLLMLVSTACNSGGGIQARAQTADQVKEEVPESAETSPYEGGMNEFPDTDPRRDTSAAGTKAKTLVETAKGNIDQKSTDSPGQFADNYRKGAPIGERVQNVTKSVGGATKGAAEDVSEGTQRGLENIKGNTQDATKGAQRAAEDTSDFAQRKTGEAAKGVERAAENASEKVSDS